MQLQARTVEILKNFAAVNQGLVFKQGNKLRTISVMKNVFAEANIPDSFEREFAIYDLNEFLSTMSLLEKPELEFNQDHILMASGKTKIKYYYSSPAVVVSPPDKTLNLGEVISSLEMSEVNLKQILKAGATLKLNRLRFDKNQVVVVGDTGGNEVSIEVDVNVNDEGAQAKLIKVENLKMVEGEYSVEVHERAVKFTNKADTSLVYAITVEANDK
jgi:hypothetical protein